MAFTAALSGTRPFARVGLPLRRKGFADIPVTDSFCCFPLVREVFHILKRVRVNLADDVCGTVYVGVQHVPVLRPVQATFYALP